ncbi:hypothetical protein GCM10020331_065030 [Ectobacillus funiculus]
MILFGSSTGNTAAQLDSPKSNMASLQAEKKKVSKKAMVAGAIKEGDIPLKKCNSPYSSQEQRLKRI